MAKKVILKDDNVEIMPITRGELVLDSSGQLAFHSSQFLATQSLPGLMSGEDKTKLDSLEKVTVEDKKVEQVNTTTNSSYRILFSNSADDTTKTEGTRKSAKLLFNPSTGALTATALIGKLDWSNLNDVPEAFTPAQHIHNTSEITALTNYSKASSASDLVTTDTLNAALGKLEYKAHYAYDWVISVTSTDTDEYINKWGEIVGFLDSVKEGTDILDEFVTRKTALVITGQKNFNTNTGAAPVIISRGGGSTEAVAIGINDSQAVFEYTNDEKANSYVFKMINNDTEASDGSGANTSLVTFAGSSAGSSVTATTFIGKLNNTLTFSAGTFSAKTYNNSETVTVNIPTHTSHLTNNSGFLTLHQSLANYVTLNTNLTITGLKTFQSSSDTTGVSLILKNKNWYSNMATAMDFYNGSSYTVPNARIETKMVGNGNAGGTLIFYTLTKHASTNPNPNGLTERLRINDNGLITITGNLTVTGTSDFSAGTVKLDVLNIPTSNGGTTFGPGSNGQVLKSNGTTVYWASDRNSNTWRAIQVNGTQIAGTGTSTYALNFISGTGITVAGASGSSSAANSITITNAGVRSTTINGDYLRVNTNGTNNDLTIPYATKAGRLISNSGTNLGGLSYYYAGGIVSSTDKTGAFAGPTSGTIYSSILRLLSHTTAGGLYYRDLIFDVNSDNIWSRRVTNSGDPVVRTLLHSGNYTSYLGYIGTTAVQSSSAALALKGITTATLSSTLSVGGKIYLTGTTADTAHILFTRTNYNYITFPDGYSLAFGIATGSASTMFRMDKTALFPERTNEVTLGTSSLRWKGIYGINGHFSGSNAYPLVIDSSHATENGLVIRMSGTNKTWVGYTSGTGAYLYTYTGPHKIGVSDSGVGFIDSNTILHSGNSSISGGGSSWGSSITVKINGTSKTLTIPANPNTDNNVKLSETTTSSYRPVILGYTSSSTAGSGMTTTTTNVVYASNKFYALPSTGTLYATTFSGKLSWDNITGKPSTFTPSSHTHSYIPLAGGTMSSGSAQIQRAGSSTSWYLGRSNAMIRINSYTGYNAIASMKTTNGDWSLGVYSNNVLYFTYVTDTNFNAGNNTTTALIYMNPSGHLYATHFYESSDINLKTNIENIDTSDNMPILKSFDWKSDGTHSYGLIAQELEEQGYSELVSKEGEYKTVNYSAALSLIVGKLQVKIKELEKEIEILKNK